MSLRADILAAVVTRLQAIDQADERFVTAAGLNIQLGDLRELGEGDPDEALAVHLVEDDVRMAGPAMLINATLQIGALCKVTTADPWTRVEQILADIKVAMEISETPERRLAGLLTGPMERRPVQAYEREPGSLTAGLVLSYSLQWKEGWGNP